MFEVVERDITKTEVEKVAVFTCDMCGREEESEMVEHQPPEWGYFVWASYVDHHLCPTCAEKVREFFVFGPEKVSFSEKTAFAKHYSNGENGCLKKEIENLKQNIKTLEHDNEKLEKERDELKEMVESLEKDRIVLKRPPKKGDPHYNVIDDLLKKVCAEIAEKTFADICSPKPTTYAEACAGLKPFDRVLVRFYESSRWAVSFFGYVRKNFGYVCINETCWDYCLPYEQYKHLLGTSDSPWEE